MLAQIFGSKFWHTPPWQTRYQNLVPLEKSRKKYFYVSMIFTVKRYHLAGISNFFPVKLLLLFLLTIINAMFVTQIRKCRFLVP